MAVNTDFDLDVLDERLENAEQHEERVQLRDRTVDPDGQPVQVSHDGQTYRVHTDDGTEEFPPQKMREMLGDRLVPQDNY